jgi:hypothetical protein
MGYLDEKDVPFIIFLIVINIFLLSAPCTIPFTPQHQHAAIAWAMHYWWLLFNLSSRVSLSLYQSVELRGLLLMLLAPTTAGPLDEGGRFDLLFWGEFFIIKESNRSS